MFLCISLSCFRFSYSRNDHSDIIWESDPKKDLCPNKNFKKQFEKTVNFFQFFLMHFCIPSQMNKHTLVLQMGHRGKGGVGAGAASGRLVCDVKISAKELIRCRSYDLTELVSHVLKKKRAEIDVDMLRGYYK